MTLKLKSIDGRLFLKLILGVPIIGKAGLKVEILEKRFVKLSPFPKTTLGFKIIALGKRDFISFSPSYFEFA